MHIANLANDVIDVKIVTETEWLAMENEKRELEEEQRNSKQTYQRSN
jgi:hypothetical protein